MPEIIRSLPSADYHALKALSASMAIALVERCPLIAFTESSFNPALEIDHKPAFDVGTALHLAVLEPDRFAERTVCHGFDDYRSKDAREARDAAYDAGKTPLKPAEADLVFALRDSIHNTPEVARLLAQPGDAEVTLTWEFDGLPCKARPDFLAADASFAIDLKSAVAAHPDAISRKAMQEGWQTRSAFYMAGIHAVTGRLPDSYWYVVAEKSPPYICQLYEMDAKALVRGEQIVGRAVHLFRECLEMGVWPKYRNGPSVISLPNWAEFRYAEMEEEGLL